LISIIGHEYWLSWGWGCDITHALTPLSPPHTPENIKIFEQTTINIAHILLGAYGKKQLMDI
jgi:hypothetical protein